MNKTGTALARFLFILFAFSIIRLGYLVYNFSFYENLSFLSISTALFEGIRFDISFILTYLMFYFLLVLFLPQSVQVSKIGSQLLKAFFVAPSAVLLGFCLVDYEYIRITGTRLTLAGTAYKTDLWDQLPILGKTYWAVPLGLLLIFLFLHKYYPPFIPQKRKITFLHRLWIEPLKLFTFVVLSILGIRGGTQAKVLHSAHAFEDGNLQLGLLRLNTPFHMVHTRKSLPIEQFEFFRDSRVVIKELRDETRRHTENPLKANPQENIVLIILESFGTEYTKQGRGSKSYTPFLDSLADKGFLFENHYSSGRTSIEAIPSLLGGVPSLLSESFISSPYQSNRVERLGELFKEKGYWTGFFHSGKKGTMFFDVSASLVGVEHYFAFEDYPERERDYDSGWGIWDFMYYSYFVDELSKIEKPFFASLFTLSSHSPYNIHPDYKDRFPKGTHDIHESLGFADEALRQFFEKASKQKWYDNTLFVVTADHTQENSERAFSHPTARFRVPMIFFHPKKNFKGILNPLKVTSHVDLVPSLKDYFSLRDKNHRELLFGDSVFSTKSKGFAVIGGPSCYWMVYGTDVAFRFVPSRKRVESFLLKDDPYLEKPLQDLQEDQRKGQRLFENYIQYFNEGAVRNSWYQNWDHD